IHGAILYRRQDAGHVSTVEHHRIQPIDLVVVSLYPFEKTQGDPAATDADKIEMIDVGGPAMLRAAAKNHESVAVVAEPSDIPRLLEELEMHAGCTTLEFRRELAARAFARTASYDAAIARALAGEPFPERLTIAGLRAEVL